MVLWDVVLWVILRPPHPIGVISPLRKKLFWAVAADCISPGLNRGLFVAPKNGFHVAIVEVIPEQCPMGFPPNRDLQSEKPLGHTSLKHQSVRKHCNNGFTLLKRIVFYFKAGSKGN